MKSLRLFCLLCFVVACSSTRVNSQTILSVAGTEIIGMPDTVQFGDTLNNMGVWVRNDGNLPTLNLFITVNSLINNTVLGSLTGLLNQLGVLLPGDSVVVPLDPFVVTPQNSATGANVVVVWPAAPGSQTGDTLEDTYYIKDSPVITSVKTETTIFALYPNPATDILFLRITPPLVGEVRVYDLQGRLLHVSEVRSTGIDLQVLAPGTYILEIREKEGIGIRKRFVKL